jgi:hypothetical protein
MEHHGVSVHYRKDIIQPFVVSTKPIMENSPFNFGQKDINKPIFQWSASNMASRALATNNHDIQLIGINKLHQANEKTSVIDPLNELHQNKTTPSFMQKLDTATNESNTYDENPETMNEYIYDDSLLLEESNFVPDPPAAPLLEIADNYPPPPLKTRTLFGNLNLFEPIPNSEELFDFVDDENNNNESPFSGEYKDCRGDYNHSGCFPPINNQETLSCQDLFKKTKESANIGFQAAPVMTGKEQLGFGRECLPSSSGVPQNIDIPVLGSVFGDRERRQEEAQYELSLYSSNESSADASIIFEEKQEESVPFEFASQGFCSCNREIDRMYAPGEQPVCHQHSNNSSLLLMPGFEAPCNQQNS